MYIYDINKYSQSSLLENEEHLSSYQKCTSDNARKKVPGSCYIEKIANFQKIHCKRGELFTDTVIREGCREHLDGTLCDYCSSHHWIGPELSRVPQPVPDQANPPHFLPVWRTTLNNDQGKPRSVDDYQPRAQISRLFKSGSLNLENNEAIENFSMQYATDSDLVKKAIEHLLDIVVVCQNLGKIWTKSSVSPVTRANQTLDKCNLWLPPGLYVMKAQTPRVMTQRKK